MQSFKEFVSLWQKYQSKPNSKLKHLLFLVVYQDNLEWSYCVEKLTQMTTLLVSGGSTGAGTGHNVKHCLKSEVDQVLKDSTECTHAMVVSVGMIFDMTIVRTQIDRFIHFSKTDNYCKAHIMAFPNKLPYCHDQHVELNLSKWREYGFPAVYGSFEATEVSKNDYHDGYTPFYIKTKQYEIKNFVEDERKYKGYAYPISAERIDECELIWYEIKKGNPNWFSLVSSRDNYFRHLYARSSQCYYVVNNEYTFIDKIKEQGLKFDLIYTPAAGYIGEMFANELDFNGKVIFYDYYQKNVDAKRITTEMNMNMNEIKKYSNYVDHNFDFSGGNLASEKAKDYKDEATLLKYQANLVNPEFRVIDLMNINLHTLANKVEGKSVLFNASNIFGYHMVHAAYTLKEIDYAYTKIISTLNRYANKAVFRGTNPAKKMVIK